MKPLHIKVLLKTIILLAGLLATPAWAACAFGEGTGMGGTGIASEGTGMGGTGIVAGKVMFSHGNVVALNNGNSRPLAKGDEVCVGDTIQSAKAASAQLVMVDNEMIAVRPETKLRIDSYSYRKKRDDNIALALLDGAARIISGSIGKRLPQNDLIKAGNVTIGIRGTDHEAAIILPGQNSAYPAGVYDRVNSGVTFIKTEKGSIDIHPNQVGFTASHLEMPQILQTMPAFYNTLSLSPSRSSEGKGETGMQKEHGDFGEWSRGIESGNRPLPEPRDELKYLSPDEMMQSGSMTAPLPEQHEDH